MVSEAERATRENIVGILNSSRAELRRSIEGLTHEQMEAADIGGWSVKDMLAHIAFWDEVGAQDFRRVAAGRMPALLHHSHERTDDLNDIVRRMRHDFPLDQVLAELESSREEILSSIADLPDEAFTTGFVPAYLAICASHDEEHSGLIDNWREEAGI